MVSSQPTMQVKLRFDDETGRILYMEAGKDFVDLLFSFLLLPAGTAIQFLADAGHSHDIGSISNVYRSAHKLKESYFINGKGLLLEPQPENGFSRSALLLESSTATESAQTRLFKCDCSTDSIFASHNYAFCSKCKGNTRQLVKLYKCRCGKVVSSQHDSYGRDCPSSHDTSQELQLSNNSGGVMGSACVGFVQENVLYLITDDLEVKISSTIESIMILNKLKVEKLDLLNSIDVSVTSEEVLDLLQASYTTSQALNYVFAAKVRPAVMASKKPPCSSSTC